MQRSNACGDTSVSATAPMLGCRVWAAAARCRLSPCRCLCRFPLAACPFAVQLEAKCTEFQRLGAGQPHVEASLRLEAAPQAAEVGPAAAAADGDVTAAQPSPSQQLQWRAARLRQQLDAKSAELAAIQEQLREQSAAARAAEEQVQAVQARAAAADQRAAEAEAKWQAGDAGRRQLQQQLKHQAAPRRDAAELPGSQPAVPCPATAASQPAAAAVPALAGTADAAAAASLPQLLQDFKQQIEASLRQELQQRLLPQLRHEISAAVQLHSQQQAVPQPRSMSPSVAHQPAPPPPLESPQGASGPGRPPPPPPQQQQQQAVPAAAANVAGATSRARSPSTSSVMDISEEDEAPPPPPPANPRQPASRQAADDSRVPPGFSLRAQQQAPKPDQQPADQLQPVRAQPQAVQAAAVPSPASVAPPRPLPSPQQAAAGQVLLPPPPQLHLPAQPASWQQPSLQQAAVPGGARGVQGEAQQAQPPLAGSAGAQVAAAVAAARALSAGLTSAAAPAGAQPKAGGAITTAPASQEKQQQQQKPQQQQEKPQQKQPPQQQREQQRAAAAVAEASDQPAAAPRAPAVPAGAPPQQRSQEQHDAAQAEAAAEELPPWLAVAASIRAQQRQAASPGEAGRRKLHQWQQLATAHADTAPGRPPKTLPFAVAEGGPCDHVRWRLSAAKSCACRCAHAVVACTACTGADPVDIVAQAAAGQLPYCCPPCRAGACRGGGHARALQARFCCSHLSHRQLQQRACAVSLKPALPPAPPNLLTLCCLPPALGSLPARPVSCLPPCSVSLAGGLPGAPVPAAACRHMPLSVQRIHRCAIRGGHGRQAELQQTVADFAHAWQPCMRPRACLNAAGRRHIRGEAFPRAAVAALQAT